MKVILNAAGTIAATDNPFVIEQWKKAGLQVIEDEAPAQEPEQTPEEKPKKGKRQKPAEPLGPIPGEAEKAAEVMPKPVEPVADEEIKRPGEA